MPEGGQGGRKGPGWFSPRATQFNLPAFPLRLQVPGWCIASFFVIPFLISYFAVTVKWFNFADFFGRVAIFACRACIYVSFLYPFRLRAVINHKRNANCAQICCIRKNICYIAWQSKRRMIDTPNGIFSSDISQLQMHWPETCQSLSIFRYLRATISNISPSENHNYVMDFPPETLK